MSENLQKRIWNIELTKKKLWKQIIYNQFHNIFILFNKTHIQGNKIDRKRNWSAKFLLKICVSLKCWNWHDTVEWHENVDEKVMHEYILFNCLLFVMKNFHVIFSIICNCVMKKNENIWNCRKKRQSIATYEFIQKFLFN